LKTLRRHVKRRKTLMKLTFQAPNNYWNEEDLMNLEIKNLGKQNPIYQIEMMI
jgi:hypothetical protein